MTQSNVPAERESITVIGADRELTFDATRELLDVLELALLVNSEAGADKGFDVGFRSLLIAAIYSDRGMCHWLDKYVSTTQVDRGAILAHGALGGNDVAVRRLAKQASLRTSFQKPRLRATRSASRWLATAVELATREARYSWVGLRHLIGAFVFDPLHPDEVERWGFRTATLHESFLGFVSRNLKDDLKFWEKELGARAPDPARQPTRQELDLSDNRLEPHVMQALRLADALAGKEPITALRLIEAAICLAPRVDSGAFACLEQWLNLPLPSPVPEESSATPGPERVSESVRRLLAWKQAQTGSQRSPIWGRDLVTAALLSDEPELARAIDSFATVRDRWYGFLTTDAERRDDDWAAWWQHAGVKLPGPGRAAYAAETDEGVDKLGVEAEAAAFARLMLDRDVKAPLSIGLLGDWGSGKSFFIEQIKKQILALQKSPGPELYRHVVEVEFNAWHASDSNLWASLVTHIFDEIWEKVNAKGGSAEAARRELVEQIQQARGAVHEAERQVDAAREALQKAEDDLEKRKGELSWTKYAKAVISTKELAELAKASGWHTPLETINDIEDAAQDLGRATTRLRLTLTGILEHPGRNVLLPVMGVALLATAAWSMVDQSLVNAGVKQVGKWLTGVAGVTSVLITPLLAAGKTIGALATRLDNIKEQYEKSLKTASKVEQREIGAARRELESAKASVGAATARLAALLNEEASLDPRRKLSSFLHERVQSTVYRAQQGIISLIYKDFKQLSDFMKELRDPKNADKADAAAIQPFERIIIYVDDLDRCRPDQVVRMLEAVHLLLALDLFVVVVAVDARWLTRALELHYKDLLTSEGASDADALRASTPQNYLEKIFQITYALSPMDPKYFEGYVRSLTGAEPEPEELAEDHQEQRSKSIAPPASGSQPKVPARSDGAAARSNGQRHDATKSTKESGAPLKADTAPRKAKELPKAKPVHIGEAEQQLICALVPLLPTPRVAKRLVNVYRLIKSKLGAQELDTFEEQGRAASCLLMLAVLFGRPRLAGTLLIALHEQRAPFDQPGRSFAEAVEAFAAGFPSPKPAEKAQWDALTKTLKDLGKVSPSLQPTVGDCAREPVEIARYSLVSGHDWHTWPRRADLTTAAAKTAATRPLPAAR